MEKKYTIYTEKKIKDTSVTIFTDLHDLTPQGFKFLEKQIQSLEIDPTDYVFLLGDLVNRVDNVESLNQVKQLLYKLKKIKSKKIVIFGNHDKLGIDETTKEWTLCDENVVVA